jgi:hypothetical protein
VTASAKPARSTDEPDEDRLAAARAALLAGAASLGIRLTSEQQVAFDRYAALLRQGKRTISLTALVDPLDVAIKHFLDSLSISSVPCCHPARRT